MKRILLEGHDATVMGFVADHSPIERPEWPANTRAFGILRGDGALVGGVVFSNYHPKFQTIEISAACVSIYVLSPDLVAALGDYAFRKLACNRVWARTAVRNKRAIKLLKHIGFTHEGDLADHYGVGQPAGTYRMLKREWQTKMLHKEAA